MSSIIATASPYQLLEDVHHHFTDISGLPVIDHEYKCVGVLSKKDVKNSAAGVWICPAVVLLLLLLLPPDVFFFSEFFFPFFSWGVYFYI
jgi:CBS domain-containing protein